MAIATATFTTVIGKNATPSLDRGEAEHIL